MMQNRIARVRMVKNYSTAHNHVAVGQVLEENNVYLRINCRIFHFATRSGRMIGESETAVRIIPWLRIEVIAELPDSTDWKRMAAFDTKGNFVLLDENQTLIARARSEERKHSHMR